MSKHNEVEWFRKVVHDEENQCTTGYWMIRHPVYEGGFTILDSVADICLCNKRKSRLHGYSVSMGGRLKKADDIIKQITADIVFLLESGKEVNSEFTVKRWREWRKG